MKRHFDVAITNARILDGTGNPWFVGDIGIIGDRIFKIGRIDLRNAKRVIDASGKTVCPGFIDAHSHSDMSLTFDPRCESTIRQGITTLVVGQCGVSLAPVDPKFQELLRGSLAPFLARTDIEFPWRTFEQYIGRLKRFRLTSNIVHLVGHGTVRIAAMGFEEREPTTRELDAMRAMVAEAMRAGAVGMSAGLVYPPGVFSKTKELIELAQVVAKYGGVYFSHIRGEGDQLINAVKEAIRIGEGTGVPVHISHHKAAGRRAWGKTKKTLQLMETARSRGVDVTYDQYPYTAAMTSLITLLPPWVHEGGMEKLLERLRNNETWMKIRRELETETPGRESILKEAGWKRIIISSVRSEPLKRLEGRSLAEVAKLWGKRDEFAALRDLLLKERGEVTMIMFHIDESDVEYAMRGRYQMFGTDSWSVSPTGLLSRGKPHPRFYGTYPRILSYYVRQKRVLTLEDAIRRMTSFPAQRLGLRDRGLLREGFYADIVIFDPETIKDKATYDRPSQFPDGIEKVLVNGQVVVDSHRLTRARPGRILVCERRWKHL